MEERAGNNAVESEADDYFDSSSATENAEANAGLMAVAPAVAVAAARLRSG